CHHYYSAPHSV
nr:immunoglobulin light chain junction region [Macaca mulatta]